MATLSIATQANQAITLPALLVATYAGMENSQRGLTIHLEDAAALKSGKDVVVELAEENSSKQTGAEAVISSICEGYALSRKLHHPIAVRV